MSKKLDPDYRALKMIHKALQISTPRMVEANVKFVMDVWRSHKKQEKKAGGGL